MTVKKGTKTTFWGFGKGTVMLTGAFFAFCGGVALLDGAVTPGLVLGGIGGLLVYAGTQMASHHQVTWKG